MKATLTLIALMMYLTCLHGSGTNGQQSTEMTVEALKEEFERKMGAAKQETEDMMTMTNAALESQRAIIEGLVQKLEGQDAVIDQLQNIVMKEQIESLVADPKHDDDPIKIAFSVSSHSIFGPVEVDTNIEFENVTTNVGGGWSTTAHAFFAPAAGYYMFTTSALAATGSEDVAYCHIVHSHGINQDRVATAYSRNDAKSNSAANSVILKLEQGEIVSVQLQAGNGYLAGTGSTVYSTFSGFLILPEE